MALDDELAYAVARVARLPAGRPTKVVATLSVAYSIEFDNGTRVAVAPTKPGSRETLQRAAAACGSKACRLCSKTEGDEFFQSEIDGAWFCGTCVVEARLYIAEAG